MLTEMVVDNYIPNDTHMTEEEARVQVCNICRLPSVGVGL